MNHPILGVVPSDLVPTNFFCLGCEPCTKNRKLNVLNAMAIDKLITNYGSQVHDVFIVCLYASNNIGLVIKSFYGGSLYIVITPNGTLINVRISDWTGYAAKYHIFLLKYTFLRIHIFVFSNHSRK